MKENAADRAFASKNLFGPLLIALAAWAAVVATLSPNGAGPGVACDELYHVFQGKQLVTAVRQQGFAFFQKANIEQNFSWPANGPPVQAPLGHWLLGWTNYLFDPVPDNPDAVSLSAARFAPAAAFALLVFIVGAWTSRRTGGAAGTVAAAALALTPRAFGHAHLAALDTLTTLFFIAALLAAANAARGGRWWHFALAGVVWGMAMLVRLHGALLAPPIVLWLLWIYRPGIPWTKSVGGVSSHRFSRETRNLRRLESPPTMPFIKAAMPFLKAATVWGAAGMATLFLGWPWLWHDTYARLWRYFASGAVRQSLHVFYWGQIWADRDAPWHYPWVMFAVTVPLGLLALGIWGLFWRGPQNSPDNQARCFPNAERSLLVLTFVFVLGVFSWPGVPVYDGVRLFLMVFPIWAIFVGFGAGRLLEHPARLLGRRPLRLAALSLFMVAQGIGLTIYAPSHLSYYNLLTGGLAGAERLGFEATYWGETVREPLLAEAAARSVGAPIIFAPSLAQFQYLGVTIASPALHKAGVELIELAADQPPPRNCRYAIVYNRRADPAEVNLLLARGRVVAEYKIQGVWLARLVELATPIDLPSRGGTISGLP